MGDRALILIGVLIKWRLTEVRRIRIMQKWVEIRSYNLTSGSSNEFHRLVLEASLPLLAQWGVDVVAYGPSAHDDDSYYLIRAFDSLEERHASEEAFYSSPEWREGPREKILTLIESYTTIVMEMDDAVVDGLRAKDARR